MVCFPPTSISSKKKVPPLGVCPRYRQQGELLSLLRDIKGEGGELRKKVGGGCFVVLGTCIHLLLVSVSIQGDRPNGSLGDKIFGH